MLQISDTSFSNRTQQQPISLLEFFIKSKGLQGGLATFLTRSYRHFSESQWQFTLLPLVNNVAQLV